MIRIGGDEFVVVLPNIYGAMDAELCANKIRRQFQQPLSLSGHTVRLSCSIGHALFPDEGETADTWIAKADARMYTHKRARRHACEMVCAV